MLIDSHAHLDDNKYDQDRESMLQRAQESGVKQIINVGYDLASSRRSVDLAEKYDFIFAAVGIHPHDAQGADEATWVEIKKLAAHPKVVALGEMGLDYFRNLSPKETQRKVFRSQLNLAKEMNKPIIVHDREAHGEIMEMLKKEKDPETIGVLHCFSGSWEMAQECIKMGFYISMAGPVTFQNAPNLHEIAVKVPLDRLLVETDSPYLAPSPFRGKRNESAHVRLIAEKIASLRQISLEELAGATSSNTKKLFGF